MTGMRDNVVAKEVQKINGHENRGGEAITYMGRVKRVN
jgi:hypothetical protein